MAPAPGRTPIPVTTAIPNTEPQQAPAQPTHFFVLTFDIGGKPTTASGGFNPSPSQTRQQAYHQIYASVLANFPAYTQLPVLFFSIERNHL
jgi:hypothetical protein